MRKEFGDDYLIINEAIFLSEIKSYRLRSCLCVATYITEEVKNQATQKMKDWFGD